MYILIALIFFALMFSYQCYPSVEFSFLSQVKLCVHQMPFPLEMEQDQIKSPEQVPHDWILMTYTDLERPRVMYVPCLLLCDGLCCLWTVPMIRPSSNAVLHPSIRTVSQNKPTLFITFQVCEIILFVAEKKLTHLYTPHIVFIFILL